MTHRRVTLAALGMLLALSVAGCGGDSAADDGDDGDGGGGLAGDTTGDDDGGAPDDVVVMEGSEVSVRSLDNTFQPERIQVAPGTTVTWTNDGRNEHDVLSVEGDDWGVEVEDFQPGATYSHTFDEPGVYEYYCSIHGTTTAGMIGTLVVEE
jgi:plastocyanin